MGLINDSASSMAAGRAKSRAQGPEPGQGEWASLLAAIAHRLSQPLTALRGTLELARLKAKSAAEYRAAVEKALESADRVAWLLQELRELAEASAPAGEVALTNLDEVTGSVLEDLRPLAAARGVVIENRLEKSFEARTYPEHLYQVLLKAVHHAILRSPEGKTVRIDLRSVPDGAQWVIADEGAPFPFAETELALNTLLAGQHFAGGLGESVLALVTAKQFIEALGGSLSVQNSAEGENRVLIHLPGHP
jgi:two-component system heavy metal sensor histidine kinase CusS